MFYWDFGQGGVQHMMRNLAEALVDRGHLVEFVIAGEPGVRDPTAPKGVGLTYLRARGPLAVGRRLREAVKRLKPDILYSAMPTCNVIAILATRGMRSCPRVVVSERSSPTKELNGAPTWRYRAALHLERYTYPLADAIVAVSDALAAELAVFAKLPPSAIRTVHNPTFSVADSIDRSRAYHRWLTNKSVPVVLGVGRLVDQKDFPFFIDSIAALSKMRPIRAIILGEGHLRESLEAKVREMGLSEVIDLPGHAENILDWFAAADVFALTSKWEGFGNVLAQAMAAGCPVVSIDCPVGPAEILDDGRFGTLVPPGDAAAFARALQSTLSKPQDSERLRRRAELFSTEHSVRHYEELFRALSPAVP